MRRLLGVVCLLAAVSAQARAAGIQADGCDGCHSGASGAQVTVTASPASPSPGDAVMLTITLTGPGSAGGFFLSSRGDQGTFAGVAGQNTRLLGTGVAHASPKAASGGRVTWQVQWTAPSTPGGTDFDVAVVSGNGNNASSGDAAGFGRLSVAWGCSGATYYRDWDGDGVGKSQTATTKACSQPPGYAAVDGDCDDFDPLVKPGGVEACNGRDDTCDGVIDEGLTSTLTYPDNDGDGYGAANGQAMVGCASGNRAANNLDCNDNRKGTNPTATETCNLLDDNCNNKVDDGIEAVCGVGACQRTSLTCDVAFCTPGSPTTETCNGVDDDCNGETDDGDLCPSGKACYRGACVANETVPEQSTEKGGCAALPWPSALALLAAAGLLRRRRQR